MLISRLISDFLSVSLFVTLLCSYIHCYICGPRHNVLEILKIQCKLIWDPFHIYIFHLHETFQVSFLQPVHMGCCRTWHHTWYWRNFFSVLFLIRHFSKMDVSSFSHHCSPIPFSYYILPFLLAIFPFSSFLSLKSAERLKPAILL